MSDMALTQMVRRLQTQTPTREFALELAGAATMALSRATEPRTVKGIADQCGAVVDIFKRLKVDLVALNAMKIAYIESQRKLGELLDALLPDGRPPKDRDARGLSTLDELGISEYVSRTCRKLASVDAEDLRSYYAHQMEQDEISIRGILNLAHASTTSPPEKKYTAGDVAKAILLCRELKAGGAPLLAATFTLPGGKVVEI